MRPVTESTIDYNYRWKVKKGVRIRLKVKSILNALIGQSIVFDAFTDILKHILIIWHNFVVVLVAFGDFSPKICPSQCDTNSNISFSSDIFCKDIVCYLKLEFHLLNPVVV